MMAWWNRKKDPEGRKLNPALRGLKPGIDYDYRDRDETEVASCIYCGKPAKFYGGAPMGARMDLVPQLSESTFRTAYCKDHAKLLGKR